MADHSELESMMDSFLATRETRREDWDTLNFQTKAGDQFRRAQIRYLGSGGTGHHEGDSRILQAEHFTFSNMLLPPGAEGPEHNHHDVEEALGDVLRKEELEQFPGQSHERSGLT